MKFIVSSLAIRKFLKEIDLDVTDGAHELEVHIKERELFMGNKKISIESSFDSDKAFVSVKSLRKLSQICGLLKEQPIVILLETNEWINIQSIVI